MSEQPPQVPGYIVERRLGGGGDAAVWVALDERSGTRVALKVLRARSTQAAADARREATLLAAVAHPHLLRLLDVADGPAGPVLVLELAEGGSLAAAMASVGTLRPGEVVTACAPIGQALDAAHRRGLVHGDVSPANVLFTREGRPVLADLGLARLIGEAPAEVGHTEGFTAPEVRAGVPPTPAADVYGLAAVAWAALDGSPYDPGRDAPPGVPPQTAAALRAALDPDPAARPSASDLARALFEMADPRPVRLARPATAPEEPGPVEESGPEAAPAGAEGGPAEGAASEGGVQAGTQTRRRPAATPAAAQQQAAPGSPATRRGGGSRRVDRGRLAALAAAPVLLAGAVVLGVQLAGDGEQEPSPAATLPAVQNREAALAADPQTLCGPPQPAPAQAPPDPADWTQTVRGLYEVRTRAFAELDPALLCEVYLPTSRNLALDLDRIKTYAQNEVRPVGLAFDVSTAVAVGRAGGVVQVDVTDELPPYQLVDDDGDVRATQDGLPEETWRAELVPSYDGTSWRFG